MNNELLAKCNSIYVVLILFGSYFVVMPPTIIGLDFTLFSLPLKYGILFMAIILIFNNCFKYRANGKLNFTLFLSFIFFYSIRVIYDLEFRNIFNVVFDNKSGYYQALVYLVIVSISLFYIRKLDFNFILNFSFYLLLISTVLAIYNIQNSPTDMLQRAEGRFEGAQGINSIDFGHYGVSLSLISLILYNKNKNFFLKTLNILGIVLGLFVMFMAGSRSPFLALLLSLICYQVFTFGIGKGIIYLFVLLLPFLIFYDAIVDYLEAYGSNFIVRLIEAIDGDTSERDGLFNIGFNSFLDNPFLGDSFLINSGPLHGTYPHNLILESFMAIGFTGGCIFIILLLRGIRNGLYLFKLNSEKSFLAILLFQQIVLSLFSLSIYTHVKYWFIIILVLNIKEIKDVKLFK